MNKQVSFWYPVHRITQKAMLPGVQDIEKDVPVEGHIVYSEVLMCGQSREKIKNDLKAIGERKVTARIFGVSVCPKCIASYKKNPDLPYQKWIHGLAVQSKEKFKYPTIQNGESQ